MATAKKLKSGNWRCLAYVGTNNGKRQYKSFTAATKKEAEYLAITFSENNKKTPISQKTLGDIVDKYIDNKTNILSATTIREYRRIRKSSFQSLFDMNVDDINALTLQSYINDECSKVTAKSTKNRFSLILSALKEYYPDKSYKVKYPQRSKPQIHIPSTDDIKQILNYVKGSDMEIPIMLGAFVGMRRGEICAVDKVVKRRIPINKVKVLNENGDWIIQDRAKTEAGNRNAYAPKFVIDALNNTKLPISLTPNQISDRFSNIVKALNLPHYRFHDLRHYYASVLMAAGVPDKYVMERIGHATDNMLKSVYQHTMQEKNKEIDNTIDSVFNT